MAIVFLVNPRTKKALTQEQVESKQAKAVQFVQNVLGDEEKAAELAALSPAQYAERRGLEFQNPKGKGVMGMGTQVNPRMSEIADQLGQKLDELPDKIAAKIAECLPKVEHGRKTSEASARSNPRSTVQNPSSAVQRRLDRLRDLRGERDEILDAIGDALDCLDDDDPAGAEEVLDDVLGQYDTEENGDDED